jgi:hypothetical protein
VALLGPAPLDDHGDVALHHPDQVGVAPPISRHRRDTGSPPCELCDTCGAQPPAGSRSYGREACASMVLRTIARELVIIPDKAGTHPEALPERGNHVAGYGGGAEHRQDLGDKELVMVLGVTGAAIGDDDDPITRIGTGAGRGFHNVIRPHAH